MAQETLLVDVMGRPLNSTPTYVYHPRGIGRIYWRGEFRNLPGDYNSAESLAAYHRLCQHVAVTGKLPQQEPDVLTVAGLVERFTTYAAKRYEGSKEALYLSYATKALADHYADTPAKSFGPFALKTVRSSMIEKGLCRNTANKRTKQIVMVFAWAVEEELIGPEVWQALKAVRPIPKGRDGAKDYDPVRPVPAEVYKRTIEHIAPHYREALEVQRMTGMRSGELLSMRPQDLEFTDTHWFYRPRHHKTKHVIGDKVIGIPHPATVILAARMPKDFTKPFFPWRPDTHYHAVIRVCDKHGIPRWHPHMLRHGVSTLCVELFGESGKEAARLVMGHTHTKTTDRYVAATTEALRPILDEIAKALAHKETP